ncbi:MAG: cbb3-type cytochrome oxidase assembly protein CcoS [Gammaproteobacteria bacterium]|nr:cbb3-type cytochrome oxidase assembly protein CcoS [Gammaproteobacteria bacterium]
MEVIFLLIPLVLLLVAFVVWAFWWAIRSGQFDDMEGPAHRILMDDEQVPQGDVENKSRDSGLNADRSKP